MSRRFFATPSQAQTNALSLRSSRPPSCCPTSCPRSSLSCRATSHHHQQELDLNLVVRYFLQHLHNQRASPTSASSSSPLASPSPFSPPSFLRKTSSSPSPHRNPSPSAPSPSFVHLSTSESQRQSSPHAGRDKVAGSSPTNSWRYSADFRLLTLEWRTLGTALDRSRAAVGAGVRRGRMQTGTTRPTLLSTTCRRWHCRTWRYWHAWGY